MASKKKKKDYLDLTPEELATFEKIRKGELKSSYMLDYTKKKLDKEKGFGKINTFIDGNRINPKVISTRNEPNKQYIKRNQAVLSKSKTGVSTYQYDYCGYKQKKNIKAK